MTEQFLNRTQIRAARQQVCRERMPQRVRRRVLRHTVEATVCAQRPLRDARIEPGAASADKQRRIRLAMRMIAEPVGDGGAHDRKYRHDALLRTFAAYAESARTVERRRVRHAERQRFGDAQAAAIQKTEQRGVAGGDGGLVGQFANVVRHRGCLCRREGARQRLFGAGCREEIDLRVGHSVPAREEAEEGPDRGQMPGAGRVAGTLRGLMRQPATKIGSPQLRERREVGLLAEVTNEKAEESGGVAAVGLHGQRRRAPFVRKPGEERDSSRPPPSFSTSSAEGRGERAAEEGERAGSLSGIEAHAIAGHESQKGGRALAGDADQCVVSRQAARPRRAAAAGLRLIPRKVTARGPSRRSTVPSGNGRVAGCCASMPMAAASTASSIGSSAATHSAGSRAPSKARTASCTRAARPAAARPAASTPSARAAIAAACSRSARNIAAIWSANGSP